jgi:hypothetical protein
MDGVGQGGRSELHRRPDDAARLVRHLGDDHRRLLLLGNGSPTPDLVPPSFITAIEVLAFPGGQLGPVPYVPEAVSYVLIVTLNLLVWYAGFNLIRIGAERLLRAARPRAIG